MRQLDNNKVDEEKGLKMGQIVLDEHLMRQYLLAALPEEKREEIEKRLLTDDDFFETFTVLEELTEDELADEYAKGELTGSDKEAFERILISTPERQEKLKLIKDLNRYRSVVPASAREGSERGAKSFWSQPLSQILRFRNPLGTFSLASAILVVTISWLWLFFKVQRLEVELNQAKAQQASIPTQDPGLKEELGRQLARNDELMANLRQTEEKLADLEQELATKKAREGGKQSLPQTSFPSVILPLLRERGVDGEGIKVINLPYSTSRFQLILSLDAINPRDYKSYQVTVEKRGGERVWETNKIHIKVRDKVSSSENNAVVTLPAKLFPGGEYNVDLNGFPDRGQSELIGTYTFRVVAQ